MALSDINFNQGEGQDFIVEVPTATYTGSLNDVALEPSGGQFLLCEIPQVQGGGNTIFIIDD